MNRMLSQSSYINVNAPLRETNASQRTLPHPFAATVFFIHEAIGKLRTCLGGDRAARTYWRGMKNVTISDDFIRYKGGTELACASTSSDLEQASRFAKSASPLLIKIEAKNFMVRGADVAFVSCFPNEAEVLYPPLTYLSFTKIYQQEVRVGGKSSFMWVAEVEPILSS